MSTDLVDWTVKEAIVGLVGRGVPLIEAGRRVGLPSKRALNELMKDDPEFREQLDDAHEVALGRLDHKVYEYALDGSSKHAELAYRRMRPEMYATGTQAEKAAKAPAVHVAQMVVQLVGQVVTGDQAPEFLSALHHPEAIEANASDDDEHPV